MKQLLFTTSHLEELRRRQSQCGGTEGPFITRELADAIVRYLKSFPVVVRTTARQPDALSMSSDPVVPSSFRTDGEWVWSCAVEYYIDIHQVSPGHEFVVYLESIKFHRREPTEAELQAAATFIAG